MRASSRRRSPLARLLAPRHIAVVGGGAWCEAVIEQCRHMAFAGAVHAVHPTREHIGDLPTLRHVDELPEAPDAVFIGVNARASIDIVASLAARGAGGAVCFANGFAESGDPEGAERQTALLDAAGTLALLGPNCYGFLNCLDGAGLWPDQHGCVRVERGVAIVTQSSNIALNLSMQRRALPIAALVTSGNQAQQGFADIGETLLAEPRITALGLHVEGFGDVRALERLAGTARRLGKGIVALKAGRSHTARRATLSHTASLAGSEAGATALMRRLGIARVDSLPVLLSTLQLLHLDALPAIRPGEPIRLASLSCSGGEAALIADAADDLPCIEFPPLGERRRDALAATLGPSVTLANPLDYDTGIWRDGEALRAVFGAMSGADIDLTVLILDFPREDRCTSGDWSAVIEALEDVARSVSQARRTARFALLATLPENLPESIAERLVASGITPLVGIDEALLAIRTAAHCRVRPPPAEPLLIASPYPSGGARVTLSEAEAKSRLKAHGLRVPRGRSVHGSEAALAFAHEVGFPLALKSEGIAHKSDAGALALDLRDEASLRLAVERMPGSTFLAEEMIADGVLELLVGVVRDDAHGFVLTLAAGGVFAELLDDRHSLLLPSGAADIDAALSRLRVAPRLNGARGRPAADRDAVTAAVLAVQSFVVANAAHLLEVEINPLVATPDAAIALDALIVLDADADNIEPTPPETTRTDASITSNRASDRTE